SQIIQRSSKSITKATVRERYNAIIGQITHTPGDIKSFVVTPPLAARTQVVSPLNSIHTSYLSPPTPETIQKFVAHIHDPTQQTDLTNILSSHAKLFDLSKITQAKTSIRHTINTADALPISSRPYPKTVEQRRQLQKIIHEMMTNNQIRPSNSPWPSPVILHKKKDGGTRFLVDYRKLNSVTKKDSFPQPTTEELLQRLGDNRYFTKFDLKSGYFQIPILEQDKEKYTRWSMGIQCITTRCYEWSTYFSTSDA
ncbi:unnamed protein product, partial [Didymodactylos carnosus]